jgi:branched-chain amino acid transport system substrate-binding protein
VTASSMIARIINGRTEMSKKANLTITLLAGFLAALSLVEAQAKDKVEVGFIGPLTGGVSVNGIGGRNSVDLAVRLRNADAKAKYEYELVTVFLVEHQTLAISHYGYVLSKRRVVAAGAPAELAGRDEVREAYFG